MHRPVMKLVLVLIGAATVVHTQTPAANPPQAAQPAAAPAANPTNLGSDPNGNPLRRALRTGHVSNYDEAKVAPYTLPDPLVMANGQPVRTAEMWRQRRAEILEHHRGSRLALPHGWPPGGAGGVAGIPGVHGPVLPLTTPDVIRQFS